MEPYRSHSPDLGARLPVTEAILSRVIVLPTGTGTHPATVEAICSLIRFAVANGERIDRRLRASGIGWTKEARGA